MSPAKAQRRKGDGPRPVIPSECEGSKKDFSPVEYVANGDLTLRVVIPRGRNDKESFFACLAPWRIYPQEWIAFHVDEEKDELDETRGELLDHHPDRREIHRRLAPPR